MKTRFFQSLVAMLFFVSALNAQSIGKGTTFGGHIGFNLQNITGKDNLGTAVTYKASPALSIGIDAEIPLAEAFYLQAGLTFAKKGASSPAPTGVSAADGTGKINLSYLEVPIAFVYKPEMSGGKLIVGFGPYFGFGVGGSANANSKSTTQSVKFKNTVLLTDPTNVLFFRGLDAGANFVVGYELSSKVSLALKAQLGLVNINPKFDTLPNDKAAISNTGFGLVVGYRL
jgi:Outer membrane protein beta-barrel domain